MDDVRLGQAAKALRRRAGLRQSEVARRARVSQSTVSRLERGHVDQLSVAAVRRVLAAMEARVDLQPRWRGGEIDRLLDARHAALVSAAAAALPGMGWETIPELSYSVYGERGSIDLVATSRSTGTAVMFEMKTSVMSVEELLRTTDAKLRLLPRLVMDRLGWRPRSVARILVLADSRTNRRRVEQHRAVLAAAFPGTTVDTKRWLRSLSVPGTRRPGIWYIDIDGPADRRGRSAP